MRDATDNASMTTAPTPLLGSAQVAAWLGMSREQVWRLWSSGRLPGYKLDRHLRFAAADIETFLASNYTGPTMASGPSSPPRTRERRPSSQYRRI